MSHAARRLLHLLPFLAAPLAAQRVPVTLVVTLTNQDGKVFPVSGRFWFVPANAADSVAVTTDGTGHAGIDLVPGAYRVRSHQRAALEGRGWYWNLPITVSGPTRIELTSANAQETAPSGDVIVMAAPPPPDAGARRRGFWMGFGPGIGSVDRYGPGEAETVAGGTLHMGGTLSPKVRVGASSDTWVKDKDGESNRQTNLSAVVMFFPSTRHGLRFTGGFGYSVLSHRPSGGDKEADNGFGLLVGVAYEAMVARKFALTPYLSFLGATFDEGHSNFLLFGLAATWP